MKKKDKMVTFDPGDYNSGLAFLFLLPFAAYEGFSHLSRNLVLKVWKIRNKISLSLYLHFFRNFFPFLIFCPPYRECRISFIRKPVEMIPN